MRSKQKNSPPEIFPLFKTIEQMSKISGIGENKLRDMMNNREVDYIQNGNRRLIAEDAIWDWYHRSKICACSSPKGG